MGETAGRRVAFVGGHVWTAGYDAPRPLDLLIEGGRILATAERGGLAGEGGRIDAAEVRDSRGQLIIPGFQDAHLHLATGGFDRLTCDLSGCESAEVVAQTVRAYALEHPGLPWVVGGGWNRELFPEPEGPTRELLDALVPDRPAALSPYDRHGLWVNSAALAEAGIDAQTPDPPHGYLRRAADGAPTGMLEEGAMPLVTSVMPQVGDADVRRAILAAQQHLLSFGITSVQDALVGTGLGMHDQHAAYCDLLRTGELSLRLTTALWWDPMRGAEQIDELLERRRALEAAAGPDRVVADTVKMMVDGTGLVFMDADRVREATVALDAAGFSIHYHSYGDATTHWVLNAIEAAHAANGMRPRHHHIAHLFVVTEPDLARFSALGVTANVQGFWSGSAVPHDRLCDSTMTHDPQNREYPYGRLLAAGAALAAGSDWPVTTPDPLEAIRVAAGQHPDHGTTHTILARNLLDVNAMLTAYTAGSAHVNGRAGVTGRIAPGFLADLAVLSVADLRAPETLREATVVETWVAGELAYARE